MSGLLRRLAAPLAVTALVLGASLVAVAAGARCGEPAARSPARALVRPALYVALAPLSDLLDAMSLLSVPQLIAFTLSLMAVYAAWRVARRRRHAAGPLVRVLRRRPRAAPLHPRRDLRRRPPAADGGARGWMTRISSSSTSTATPTTRTTRAPPSRWSRIAPGIATAGFDVAYITDHRCFDGAAEGERGNPKRAGDGTVLLSGIELPPDQIHVIALEPPDVAGARRSPRELVRAREGRARARRVPPVRIQTIPEDLEPRSRLGPAGGLGAIELLDGAPRGIAQAQRDRKTLLSIAAMHRPRARRRLEQSRLGTHRRRVERDARAPVARRSRRIPSAR